MHLFRARFAPSNKGGSGERGSEVQEWLSTVERRRAERFRRSSDRDLFVHRRGFQRRVLGAYLGRHPGEVRIEEEPGQRPRLAGSEGLFFSLSSAQDRALLALSRDPGVGVDLEALERLADPDAVEARILCPSEREAYAALEPTARAPALLRAWTRKEALLKAAGVGLAVDPRALEVGLSDAEPGRIGRCLGAAPELGDLRSWMDLPAPEGFAAAMAAPGEDWRVVEPPHEPPDAKLRPSS